MHTSNQTSWICYTMYSNKLFTSAICQPKLPSTKSFIH